MTDLDLGAIYNFRRLGADLITSGQPSEEELAAVARAGAEVVINLALHDGPYSLPDESGTVEGLGLIYEHIPVIWERPTRGDFDRFCEAMARHRDRRLYVHCAANMRASVFMALYRVLRLGWRLEDALTDVYEIWEPNETWQAFMEQMLIEEKIIADDVRARHQANRLAWNEGAVRYTQEVEETIAFLRAGQSNLHPVERAHLGDLAAWCDVAIHLQCASGRDTLSLWNEGVKRVVGVDISDVHIANARLTGAALGAPATWYRCDILDTPHELDGTADLVYTGRGALCWLHDLDGWAAVIARLLKPGGILHVFDDHPFTWFFAQETADLVPTGFDYFTHSDSSQGWPATYIGELDVPVEQQTRKYERLWPLSAIFGALRGAGLDVEHFGEHRDEFWDGFPKLNPELKARLPMTFSMIARRPRHEM